MSITALVAGSYDPFTRGHEDIVRKALAMYSKVHVVVADNPDKRYFIGDGAKRAELVTAVLDSVLTPEERARVTVVVLGMHMLAHYALSVGATVNVRGLRNSMDFQYEYNMQAVNNDIAPELITVYVATSADKAHISSSMVRGLVGYAGWLELVQKYVHPFVTIQMDVVHRRKTGE